jgi:O-antigen/teichoic acid export membrane protein
MAAPRRGVLAGRGQFGAYAWALGAEAVARVCFVGIAWVGIGPSDVWLAASLGVPLFISAFVARLLSRRGHTSSSESFTPVRRESNSDQFWYTAVAFSIQVSLGLPAVVLQAVDPDSGAAGVFVTASVYMRIPITLVGGLAVVVLSQVASYFGSGQFQLAARVVVKSLLAALTVGVVGVVALLLISGVALQVLYGSALDLPDSTVLLLGGATVAAMVVGVMTQAMFGCGRARPAAVVWISIAVCVAIGALVLPGTATAMALAVLAGQVLALTVNAVLLLAAFRDPLASEGSAQQV